MVKFLIGLVTGIALVFLSVILLFVVALRFRESPPTIAANSVLVLRLSGELPEKPPIELPSFVSDDHTPLTVIGLWSVLEKAAVDARVKAVVLEPESLSAGWAKLEELRARSGQVPKSGKPVYAYLRTPGAREYYLACGADRIYLGPSDQLMLKGLRAELMYFKKTLDKTGRHGGGGARRQVQRLRRHVHALGHEPGDARSDRPAWWTTCTATWWSASPRAGGKPPDEVRAIIDQGPFTATQALKAGLVD